MKLLSFILIVFLLLLLQAFAEASWLDNSMGFPTSVSNGGDVASLHKNYRHPKINCSYACARRCRKASRKKMCKRACGTCCKRCHCVPPGTYGNKSACPCYASLKTHGNKPKCP